MWLKQRCRARVVLFTPCLSGRSYVAKAEMSSTRCVVYSACVSGRSYVAKTEKSSTRCVVYSACLVGGAIWLKQRSRAHFVLFTPRV